MNLIHNQLKGFLVITALMLGSAFASAQSLIYYIDDRPQDYTYQNALRSVGLQWDVQFVPFGNDVSLDDAIANNEKVSEILAKRTGFGETWYDSLYNQVQNTLEEHNAIRLLVGSHDVYKEFSKQLIEPILLVRRKKTWFGHHYRVYLVGIPKNTSNGFGQVAEYKVVLKKNKVKLKSSKNEPIPFEIPENGIKR